MITRDHRRTARSQTLNLYYLPAPGRGHWYRTKITHLEHLTTHQALPPGTRAHKITSSKCHCAKRKYPTEQAAHHKLTALQTHPDRAEQRAYRCEADDRTWHLTKNPTGYTHTTPLHTAYPTKRNTGRT